MTARKYFIHYRQFCHVLPVVIFLFGGLLIPTVSNAWDSTPDSNGLYDEFYDRPTYFPDWEQPSTWPNAMYYLCDVRLGSENGPRITSYEIAVYDQNDNLRHCGRSLATQGHYSVLTIKGMDGKDTFHFKVIYGDDFANPKIVEIPNVSVPFKTNNTVGTKDAPFVLVVPSNEVFLSEEDTEAPAANTNRNVNLKRTINANEWSTICLPFAIPSAQLDAAFGTQVQLADFTGCTVDYEADGETVKSIHVNFEYATAIEANHPYIIKVADAVTEINAAGVNIIALGGNDKPSVDCNEQQVKIGSIIFSAYNSFIGNYTNGFNIPSGKLFLSGGKFWYSTGNSQMMAYRAYFDFYNVLPEMDNYTARIILTIDDEVTAIDSPSYNNKVKMSEEVFDLQGRRVKAPSKGLYIKHGRKYFIK